VALPVEKFENIAQNNPEEPEKMGLKERNYLQREVLKTLGADTEWLLKNRAKISDFVDGKMPDLVEEKTRVWELTANEDYASAAQIVIDILGLKT